MLRFIRWCWFRLWCVRCCRCEERLWKVEAIPVQKIHCWKCCQTVLRFECPRCFLKPHSKLITPTGGSGTAPPTTPKPIPKPQV